MNTLKKAFVYVEAKGKLFTGVIAARRENKGLVYVMITDNPELDDWYTVESVKEIAE